MKNGVAFFVFAFTCAGLATQEGKVLKSGQVPDLAVRAGQLLSYDCPITVK